MLVCYDVHLTTRALMAVASVSTRNTRAHSMVSLVLLVLGQQTRAAHLSTLITLLGVRCQVEVGCVRSHPRRGALQAWACIVKGNNQSPFSIAVTETDTKTHNESLNWFFSRTLNLSYNTPFQSVDNLLPTFCLHLCRHAFMLTLGSVCHPMIINLCHLLFVFLFCSCISYA